MKTIEEVPCIQLDKECSVILPYEQRLYLARADQSSRPEGEGHGSAGDL